jgi:hypothetical protein
MISGSRCLGQRSLSGGAAPITLVGRLLVEQPDKGFALGGKAECSRRPYYCVKKSTARPTPLLRMCRSCAEITKESHGWHHWMACGFVPLFARHSAPVVSVTQAPGRTPQPHSRRMMREARHDYNFAADLPLRCCGRLTTTMPGRKSKAAFSCNAVWLCRKCCHQWATTNSGRTTLSVSCGWRS